MVKLLHLDIGPPPKVHPPEKVEVVVIPDSDPIPVKPQYSGKDEEFPAWVKADMKYKQDMTDWRTRKARS